MKIGIIGCGGIANRAHIPAYLKNKKAELAYFCDIIPERAQEAVEKYGRGVAVTDYHDVLADPEVTAVSVCTPNLSHASISIDAVRAGKHVLCEKPAARVYEEALAMQQAQHETGKILNIGVVNRFNVGVNKLKELVDQGALGEIYHVYTSFRSHRCIPGLGGQFTTKSIAGGGVMIDWGVHFFDIIMYVCGDPKPLTASGETFSKLGSPMEQYVYTNMWAGPPDYSGTYDVEEGVTGIVRTDGPVISFQGAWAQNIGVDEMYIDFMGTEGGVRLQYGKDFTYYSTKNGMLTETKYQFSTPDMFENEINAFLDCIESGKKLPSHIDTNIITSKMMDAIYRSAETHREVTL